MAEWWEEAPLANQPAPAGETDQWWKAAPQIGANPPVPDEPKLRPTIQPPAQAPASSPEQPLLDQGLQALDSGARSMPGIGPALGFGIDALKGVSKPSEGLQKDINAQAAIDPEQVSGMGEAITPPLPQEGSNFAFLHRGINRNLRDLQAGRVAVGELSPQEAAQNYVAYEQEAQRYKYDPDVVESLRAYPVEGSISEVLSWMWNNPKATVTMFGDNLAGVAVGAVLPIGAGVAASPAGPGASALAFAGTAGITSGVMTAMGAISDELQDSGVDINSLEQVENAFASPEFMSKATKRAILHGVPVGVIDMITGLAGARGVGGKIVDGVWKQAFKSAEGEAVKGTVRRAMAETGVNTAIDMTGAGVGEAAGQFLSTGQVKPAQLIPEVAFELPGSIVQGGYETYLSAKQQVDPATAEMIAKAGALGQNEPVVIPDADQAAEEGRTFYGYAESGKPVEVSEDYATAERRMGEGPANRGVLIAVKPEEVEGTVNDVVDTLIASKGQAGSVIDSLVVNVPDEQKPQAIAALQTVVQAKSPQEREAAFELARSFGVRAAPFFGEDRISGVYRGDATQKRILPRIMTPMGIGEVNVDKTLSGDRLELVPISGTTSGGKDFDARRLFKALKGKIYIDPSSIYNATNQWGRKAIEPMVRIADEQMREEVFTTGRVDRDAWDQAVREEKISFNPDTRLTQGRGASIRVLDATEDEVEAALKSSEIQLPRGASRIGRLDSITDNVKYEYLGADAEADVVEGLAKGIPGESRIWTPLPLPPAEAKIAKALNSTLTKWLRDFGLQDITLTLVPYVEGMNAQTKATTPLMRHMLGEGHLGMYTALTSDVNYIAVKMKPGKSPALSYSVVAHEFGHLLAAKRFSQADVTTRAKVFAAYRRWLEILPPSGGRRSMASAARRFSATFIGGQIGSVGEMDPGWYFNNSPEYMFSFDEWFAEQIARWGTTRAKPVGTVSKFFRRLASEIIRVVKAVREQTPGEDFRAEPEIEEWIDSLRSGATGTKWSSTAEFEFAQKTIEINRPYLGSDSVPLQAESTMTKAVMGQALNAAKQINPSTVASINAHNDRFNWFYKLALTVRQVALRNPNNPLLAPLYRYLEYVDLAKQESNKIMGDADQILLKSRNLKGKGMDSKLAGFIDDLNNMVYLSPQEQQNGVRRWPSPAEFDALVRQYGLSDEALALYMEIKGFFNQTVERFYQLDVLEAGKLSDPRMQAIAMREALTRKRQMLASPYFPKSRFGNFAVTVRDANGKVELFELFDTRKGQKQRWQELEKTKTSGQTVTTSELPAEVEPFVGIPAWLLDQLNNLPGMTKVQQAWIEQLRHHLAPQRSFAKHFLKRKNTAGYSLDWRRSFGNYAFHHARNFARLKYGELARKETELLKGAEEERPDPKLSRIANMMADHYLEFINPSRDWAVLRSVTALFHLGFSPATAMMNLSQVPLVTMPFLADKFGDFVAMGALSRAAGDLATYYKKGTIAQKAQQDHHFRAIQLAVEQGVIDESQAWQLASFSGGSKSKARQAVREAWLKTTSMGMAMFSFAEQWNRRVTFRAAYDLAYNNPNAKWVQELDVRHSIEMGDLKAGLRGGHVFTEREARAFLAAKEVVQQTQFAYDKLERPKFMQGRKANLFAFYMFTQNMLFTMWNNPGAAGRYMLAMAFLAGPMGLVPDDIEDILNAVARQLFGKDFNLERYARGLVVDLIGETPVGTEPSIPPDLILHGTSRYSYGIPWLMSQVGVDWLPNVDRSKSIAINRVLPMGGLTSLLRPSADINQSIYNATQDVAGAAFGPGLALYKALSQSDLSLFDLRNWQAAMPKAARSVTEAIRNYSNAGQIDRKGAMQVPYDRNDPQHVAELIATALGYQPTRKSQFYDRQSAIYEVDQYWTTRRSQLLQDAFVDRFDTNDPDAWASAQAAIRDYNKLASQVDKKYIITTDTIKRSFQAKQKRRRELGQGIPPGVSRGAAESVGQLYPESNVLFTKRVR